MSPNSPNPGPSPSPARDIPHSKSFSKRSSSHNNLKPGSQPSNQGPSNGPSSPSGPSGPSSPSGPSPSSPTGGPKPKPQPSPPPKAASATDFSGDSAEVKAKKLAIERKLRDMMEAPLPERKKALREMMLEYHPDKSSDVHAKEVFQFINASRGWFLAES